MAYKSVKLRAPRTTAEFQIDSVEAKLQANGVRALIIRATEQQHLRKKDVTLFVNGKRVDALESHMVPGKTVRVLGTYSQANTFVALALAA